MKKQSKRTGQEENLIAMLKKAMLAEQIAGNFYKYIAGKIKDKALKNMFLKFGDQEAMMHKKLLNDRFKLLTGMGYSPDLSKVDSYIKVSSFSFMGALNIAKEAERKAIEFYKKAKINDKKYKKMYEEIGNDEKKHWQSIDKIKKCVQDIIYCKDSKGMKLAGLLMQTLFD